jgi:hypothetical protein
MLGQPRPELSAQGPGVGPAKEDFEGIRHRFSPQR